MRFAPTAGFKKIRHNPSYIGGTWAFRLMVGTEVVREGSGVITPRQAKMPFITNNLTEMLAMLQGLAVLPDEWSGMIYSDSKITLGRVFWQWKWTNIPEWMHKMYQDARARLINFEFCKPVLLDGHPTDEQLAKGRGKRGNLVSIHNVWCDKECGRLARKYLAEVR